jgi:hypothetical protein
MSLTEPSKDIKVEPKGPVVTSRKANGPLIFFGLLLILGFAYGVYYARDSGSVVVETPAAAETGSAGATGASGAGGTTGEAKATTKTTKNAPSDTLLTAILGAGAALFIVGVLYGRISTIKLPGGVEVSLTKEEEEETAKKSAEQHPGDPQKAAMVAQKAQALLREEKARGLVALPEANIESAVEKVSAQLS